VFLEDLEKPKEEAVPEGEMNSDPKCVDVNPLVEQTLELILQAGLSSRQVREV